MKLNHNFGWAFQHHIVRKTGNKIAKKMKDGAPLVDTILLFADQYPQNLKQYYADRFLLEMVKKTNYK